MRPKLAIVFLAAVALPSTGCSAFDRVNDALYDAGLDTEPSAGVAVARPCDVGVLAGSRWGRGVVLGPHTVLTVAHVAGNETEVEVATSTVHWAKARVVGRVASSPEDLVRLELEVEAPGLFSFDGFGPERLALLGGRDPAFALTRSGVHGWGRGLRPGDSGSPVIDREGRLVGLIVGTAHGGGGVLAPFRGTASPVPFPEKGPIPDRKPDNVLACLASSR